MSILSLTFIVFLMVTTAVYYTVPKKAQWIILLLASGIFYLLSSIRGVFFVLFTATTVYLATNRMQNLLEIQNHYLKENKETLSKEEKRAYKTNIKSKRKRTMISTLVLNFGILCIIKYTHFAIEQINLLINCFGGIEISNDFTLAAPLGISFYTFQSTGYLLDVFWEKQSAEKNYFKTLLFISFFPQITQGPISGFEELSAELFSKHSFLYKNYSWGAQRIIWGYFKKMVIANGVAKCVQDVFANYSQYSGISVLIGAFLYSVQIYADFSGYMDIMCGFCEVLDIRLAENFERPYFSKSVAEYWRRWHITLGAWFKNYIYYPIGMSNWNRQLAFRIKNRYGRQLAYTIPASAALIIVWLATGAWHGASWSYIVWGLLNGFFIIFSIWMEPVYDKWRSTTKVNRHSWEWKIFQTIRTFVLITLIKVLPEVGTLSAGLSLIARIFTLRKFKPSISTLFPFVTNYRTFFAAVLGTAVLFVTSLIQRKQPIRQWLEEKTNYPTRMMIYVVLFFMILYFGVPSSGGAGGFLYAQF